MAAIATSRSYKSTPTSPKRPLRRPYEGPRRRPAFTEFRDELRHIIRFEHSNIDDRVFMKSDGFPTYRLANVVDDHRFTYASKIPAAPASARLFVNFTAANNIQTNPRYRVIGIRKFA